MILTQEEKTAVVIGNIQQNTVGIDAKNVNFITSLLTEKLYSKPIQSFLREIISNAYDSHLEAKSEEPVLIKLSYDNKGYITIAIRDYGTGLSPERFDLIYKNIGSSSKRESNDYIGCLGIGRFSCLAVSNRCSITSYYNGIKDIYLMYKDEGTVHIDKLSSSPTEEHNGIEVSVTVENDYRTKAAIAEGLADVAFFSDIYVDNTTSVGLINGFNKRGIARYKNFAYVKYPYDNEGISFSEFSTYSNYKILYGDVLYPVNLSSVYLSQVANRKLYLPEGNLYLKFDIGELDITPSREALQMTDKTIKAIRNKVTAYTEEISEVFCNSLAPMTLHTILDCVDNEEYSNAFAVIVNKGSKSEVKMKLAKKFFTDVVTSSKNTITVKEGDKEITLSKDTIETLINIIRDYRISSAFSFKKKEKYRKVLKSEDYISVENLIQYLSRGDFYICKGDNIKNVYSSYVKSKCSGKTSYILASSKNEKEFLRTVTRGGAVVKGCKDYNLDKIAPETIDIILRSFLRWYFSKKTIINNNTIPKAYFTAWKNDHKKGKTPKEKVNTGDIAIWGFLKCRQSFSRLNFTDIVKVMKVCNVYVLDKDSANIPLVLSMLRPCISFLTGIDASYIPCMKMLLVATNKRNLQYCQSIGMLSETDFMSSTNPLFMRFAAIKLWAKKIGFEDNKGRIISLLAQSEFGRPDGLLSPQRQKELSKVKPYINDWYRTSSTTLDEILDNCIENNLVDWQFFAKLPTDNELTILKVIESSHVSSSESVNKSLWIMTLMKKKIIPFNVKLYYKSKISVDECIKNR